MHQRNSLATQELELPFSVYATDLRQKLINKDGSIDTSNTLDWLTAVRLKDSETGDERDALIHMNKPFDYRGYRFFQTSVATIGSARTIKLRAVLDSGGTAEDITLRRGEETRLADSTRVIYREFNPTSGLAAIQDNSRTRRTTHRPAAHLQVIKADGQSSDPWALPASAGKSLPPFLRQCR